MQVRRYEATTMKDALAAVKRELGNNAVILSTKELGSGSEGIKLYEVTAASAVQSKAGAESGKPTPSSDFAFGPDLLARLTELNEIMPTRSQMRMVEGAVRDVKTLLIESLRGKFQETSGNAHLFTIEQTLRTAGVDDAITAELTRHMNSLPPPAEIAKLTSENIENYFKDQAMRWMLKRIKISPKWTSTPGITNIHAFAGTPGAGKSTLMAKIATEIYRRDRHSIALITFNPDKVAASEQTRIFAKIIGVPHHTINTPQDLKKTVMSLKGTDLVLVDTPGQNPNSTDATKHLEIMKNLGLSLDFHLVISAAEKFSVSDRAVSAFSNIGLSSIAITKLDECPAYGEAFTLTTKWSLPLSYLTFSGEYSDGLERATRERILERVFNL